jgi:hypothetical protein
MFALTKRLQSSRDALQTLAFRTISHDEELDDSTRITLIRELSNASGTPNGMVAGQALDIEGEARAVSGKELEVIHRLKTGALIIAAARSGAIIARASETELEAITKYAAQLDCCFRSRMTCWTLLRLRKTSVRRPVDAPLIEGDVSRLVWNGRDKEAATRASLSM